MGGTTPPRCSISDDLTKDELSSIEERLDAHNQTQTGGRFHDPGVEFNVTVEGHNGEVVGGINASTKLGVMFLEVLWVADAYRERGLGERMLLEAERIGREAGCGASQTWTFSFQAPGFYQKLGYQTIGVFAGYPDGITEHVLVKQFLAGRESDDAADLDDTISGFTVVGNATEEDMRPVRSGFHDFCVAQIGDEMENPGIKVRLALRDPGGQVVGGLFAWTTLRIVVPELIWVDPPYRRQGWGRRLLMEAERIARAHGCIASQSMALSFQSPEFFHQLGYGVYGESDAYPDPFREQYFIKRL
ncbi:MAG: GNAT family N-acetyltransferase [Actinomycetota bacterium]